jgi:competence ComEA-like helix-hairpin-helix protein
MNLSFTPGERRALYFLLALLVVAGGVRMYQRFYPGTNRHYTIDVDTLRGRGPAVNRTAERKLEVGIDPNSAPQEDLELLPGIGPSLARAVIAEREENGPFVSAADLERVPGIGPRTVQRFSSHLRFP